MAKFTFKRIGHPVRTGTAAVIRKDMSILFDSVMEIGKPELFTEMAMCLRDEMKALLITLDTDVKLPRKLLDTVEGCDGDDECPF